ncbi:MAG TPA: mechanosensitive ion channel domain-containing protein, partial [Tangfeifania sp.]|nr:mechanosensitive ion channel domain-containing protein [Tangfeifania sp.]
MKYLKRFVIPVLLLLSGIFLRYFLKELDISDKEFAGSFERVGSILLIVSLAWAGIAFIRIFKNIFLEKYDVSKENNLRSRKFQTQFNIMERIIVFLIILISIGLVLMLFEDVKRIGVSLFASAGVAGVIIGLAAQRVIGAILAGIQIAITQPIRLDDVVIIEGEWGRIEEITLTYTVVRIWDQRRLVVPSTYFFDKPFQNWTRTSAEILGTVFIY